MHSFNILSHLSLWIWISPDKDWQLECSTQGQSRACQNLRQPQIWLCPHPHPSVQAWFPPWTSHSFQNDHWVSTHIWRMHGLGWSGNCRCSPFIETQSSLCCTHFCPSIRCQILHQSLIYTSLSTLWSGSSTNPRGIHSLKTVESRSFFCWMHGSWRKDCWWTPNSLWSFCYSRWNGSWSEEVLFKSVCWKDCPLPLGIGLADKQKLIKYFIKNHLFCCLICCVYF